MCYFCCAPGAVLGYVCRCENARFRHGLLRLFLRRGAPPDAKNEVRLTLGRWLAVGLEFELAADILNTAITPSWDEIEKLAAIATLRTLLNYFLEREIRQASSLGQHKAESEQTGSPASVLSSESR